MASHEYRFIPADKDLFAVYQTVYSDADIEMWYDWTARLNDTKWSDDCAFITCDGEKIGGALISPKQVMYPFLIAPFCDRRLFWKLILGRMQQTRTDNEIQLKGMPSADVDVLRSFGAEIWRPRQIMCRPTDALRYALEDGFELETPKQSDIPEMAEALRRSYHGGIAYKIFGEDSIDDALSGINNCFSWYTATNTWNHSAIVKQKSTGAIVGGCIAGINPEMVNRFSFIDDLFVLPEFRGRGLAETMLRRCIATAHADAPVVKLHVLIGNPAECLYRKMGFVPGPSFTDMKLRLDAY